MNKSILKKIVFAVLMLFAASCLVGSLAAADMNSASGTELVNINDASVKELAVLSGIGKKKAEAIIAYRNENGKFESVDDMKKVKGVGKKTFEKIKNSITVKQAGDKLAF